MIQMLLFRVHNLFNSKSILSSAIPSESSAESDT